MHHHFIDQHSGGEGFYKRLDPAVKTIAALIFIIAVATTPSGAFTTLTGFVALIFFISILSRIPALFIAKRLLVIMPFVFFIGLSLAFAAPNFRDGLQTAAMLFCKALLCSCMTLLLVTTTHFESLLKGFERLRVPQLIVMTISFMYRYIFILSDQIMTARRAKESRAPKMSNLKNAKVLANILGSVFLRTFERGEEVYMAMCARGFTGRIRTIDPPQITVRDVVTGLTLAAAPVIIRILGVAYGK